MEGPRYPADVAAALKYMDDAGWTYERVQGVLAIALAHLDGFTPEPEVLEMVVMWASEEIQVPRTPTVWDKREFDVIPADTVYVVCPHCLAWTKPIQVDEGQESRRTYWDGDSDEHGLPIVAIGDSQDFYCDDYWWQCDTVTNGAYCLGRLSMPAWMPEPDYV